MLILSRKKNERIILTVPGFAPIELVVVELRGDKARIGITADPRISCHRFEVQQVIDREKAEAAQ